MSDLAALGLAVLPLTILIGIAVFVADVIREMWLQDEEDQQ